MANSIIKEIRTEFGPAAVALAFRLGLFALFAMFVGGVLADLASLSSELGDKIAGASRP